MPENDGAANAPAATPANTPAPAATANTPAVAAPPANTTPAPGDEPMTLEEARKLRRELNNKTAKLKEYEDAQAATELAKLGDLEKANKQLADAQKALETYRARIADYAVQIAAGKLGIRDPEVAATLIRSQLTLGDDGAPTNADDLLKDLLKNKPYLKQDEPAAPPKQPSAGPTNPGRGQQAQGGQPGARFNPDTFARFGGGQKLFTTGRE